MMDRVYATPFKQIKAFKFDSSVANAFDDMVNRSIPYYQEIHQLILDVADKKIREGDLIYDLGCSTGTTISILSEHFKNKNLSFIGVDTSAPMIEQALKKLTQANHEVSLLNEDISKLPLLKSGMIIMNYTLQFIDPALRFDLMKKIYDSLRPGGLFIFSEKIASSQSRVQETITDLYYDFKRRNGYSELEISQKREALENVLIPYTASEQLELMRKAGFNQSEMIFRWYNFACFIGMKDE